MSSVSRSSLQVISPETDKKRKSTSLNSGLRVFFLIWVLYFAFFPMSGFKLLQNSMKIQRNKNTAHLWSLNKRKQFHQANESSYREHLHYILRSTFWWSSVFFYFFIRLLCLHLYKGVRITIRVHCCQMSTSNYTHNQTTLLAVVGERNQDTSPLLCLFIVLQLKNAHKRWVNINFICPVDRWTIWWLIMHTVLQVQFNKEKQRLHVLLDRNNGDITSHNHAFLEMLLYCTLHVKSLQPWWA